MNTISYPLAVLFGYKSGKRKFTFVGRDGDIVLDMKKHRDDLIRILALCDGRRSWIQVHEKVSNLSDTDFNDLAGLLEEEKIIRDGRDLYLGFHEDSSNPMNFVRNISPEVAVSLIDTRAEIAQSGVSIVLPVNVGEPTSNLLGLCRVRKSTRSFTGEPLTIQEVSELLRSMYTVGEQRSTPSAGQLYPLEIFVAVTAQSDNSPAKGLYRYDPAMFTLIPAPDATVTPEIIGRMLNSHQANDAALVVFIAADLTRPAAKYSNRGYRFALLEAGHVAQNAHLYCAETAGLGMVEYGGFQDKLAAELLELDYPKHAVLLTIVVGRDNPQDESGKSYYNEAWNLSQQLVGEGKPIEYLLLGQPTDGKYKLPRVEAAAKFRAANEENKDLMPEADCFGSGLAVTSDEAIIRALAEGYERHASGILRVDAISSAVKLETKWLDPRQLVPLQPFAYERYGLKEFDPNADWQWVRGIRHNSKEPVMVPVEMAFYPLSESQLGRPLCFSSTSNGVAAHTDRQIASEKALLELIERDAISVMWYAQREVSSLPVSMLSDDIRFRMRHWIKKGWQVKFLNLMQDSVPCVIAMIYSKTRYPSFVAGAAANFDWNVAIMKAWDEAETFLLNWRNRKRVKPIVPEQVLSVLDHGIMYFIGEHLGQLQWLIDAEEAKPSPLIFREGSDLLKHFNPVLLDLNPAEPSYGLKVVRAISERLLPINFGYGNEHVGHRRLNDLGLEWARKYPSFPHFFA